MVSIQIGKKEREYLDSFYAMNSCKTQEDKIKLLQRTTGYMHDDCEDIQQRLNVLELALISDEVERKMPDLEKRRRGKEITEALCSPGCRY